MPLWCFIAKLISHADSHFMNLTLASCEWGNFIIYVYNYTNMPSSECSWQLDSWTILKFNLHANTCWLPDLRKEVPSCLSLVDCKIGVIVIQQQGTVGVKVVQFKHKSAIQCMLPLFPGSLCSTVFYKFLSFCQHCYFLLNPTSFSQ